jgi:hypothetical protein
MQYIPVGVLFVAQIRAKVVTTYKRGMRWLAACSRRASVRMTRIFVTLKQPAVRVAVLGGAQGNPELIPAVELRGTSWGLTGAPGQENANEESFANGIHVAVIGGLGRSAEQ